MQGIRWRPVRRGRAIHQLATHHLDSLRRHHLGRVYQRCTGHRRRNDRGDLHPAYALESTFPDLSAFAAGCNWSYNSGNGGGCGGYVLTVQEAGGNLIRVGQQLYGGAGLASETTIVRQISDGAGNLCDASGFGCNGGSTGVYLVDTSQVVAPGTPMSASDGTGWVVGFSDGSVAGWNNGQVSWSQARRGIRLRRP